MFLPVNLLATLIGLSLASRALISWACSLHKRRTKNIFNTILNSVADPDPPDPYNFPGSGAVSKVWLYPDPNRFSLDPDPFQSSVWNEFVSDPGSGSVSNDTYGSATLILNISEVPVVKHLRGGGGDTKLPGHVGLKADHGSAHILHLLDQEGRVADRTGHARTQAAGAWKKGEKYQNLRKSHEQHRLLKMYNKVLELYKRQQQHSPSEMLCDLVRPCMSTFLDICFTLSFSSPRSFSRLSMSFCSESIVSSNSFSFLQIQQRRFRGMQIE